jgi:ubiquitin carboxyl-terminal hydrolase 9/13
LLTLRSYCNSIIQCLYHSPPFRDAVLNFPSRTPSDQLRQPTAHETNGHTETNPPTPGHHSLAHALSPLKSRTSAPASPVKQKNPGPATSQPQPLGKEESKDSPEYKKKMALINGPIINMDYGNSDKYGMSESLFTSLKDLFEAVAGYDSRTGVVSPQKLLEILRREFDIFRAPMHQDAHEFLNLLLNQVVENVEQYSRELEAKNSASQSSGSEAASDSESSSIGPTDIIPKKFSPPNTKWVHELFEGTLTSETRCMTCEHTSFRDEPFLDLSVDLDQFSSVTACLLRFSEEEMLCERNKFHCDRCGGLQEAEKRMKLKTLPKILALHLKRFKYTEDLQRLQKLFHHVSYPYYLRLLNTTDSSDEPDRLYELYAVVVHIGGGPYHGHYVSIVKTQDRGWLLFDDENVEPVDKSFVCEFFGGETNLACAYVLFYHETTAEAMYREQDLEGRLDLSNDANNLAPVNGKMNGVPPSPAVGDAEVDFPYLDRSATAPLTTPPVSSLPLSTPPVQNALEHVVTSPILPFLNRKKSSTLVRRDTERQEKDKREAEREMERLNRERKKAEETHAVPGRRASVSTGSRTSQVDATAPAADDSEPREFSPTPKEIGSSTSLFSLSGNIQRFKTTSKSLKSKPRIFSSSSTAKPSLAVPANRLSNNNLYNTPSPTTPSSISTPLRSASPTSVPRGYEHNSPTHSHHTHSTHPPETGSLSGPPPFRLSGASSHASTTSDQNSGSGSAIPPAPPSSLPYEQVRQMRGETGSGLPVLPEKEKKKKEKRSMWGLGRKKGTGEGV